MSNSNADRFRELHIPGRPLVLFNVWDPGSAKAVAVAGARAIATGSWSVASANGFADGERVPLDLAMGNLGRIVQAVDLPVSVDLESGYGKNPDEVARTIERSIQAGAIGCNLEDSFPESGKLRPLREQVQRLQRARAAAGKAYFINARCDIFFQKPAQEHDDAMVLQALEHAQAYAEAGADGFFAPGLVSEVLIAKLAEKSSLPLNVMVAGTTPPLTRLAQMGVARVSHGPGPYRAAMKSLEAAARATLGEVVVAL